MVRFPSVRASHVAVAPSQEMVEEGLAREVVSRVQKLRKKAKLQPSNPITVRLDIRIVLRSIPCNFHMHSTYFH